ncbi:MAG TPA: hypothetical protein VF572_00255 [Candidatus Saccharimonadales bacterium]|jgi:hypothetical protein
MRITLVLLLLVSGSQTFRLLREGDIEGASGFAGLGCMITAIVIGIAKLVGPLLHVALRVMVMAVTVVLQAAVAWVSASTDGMSEAIPYVLGGGLVCALVFLVLFVGNRQPTTMGNRV